MSTASNWERRLIRTLIANDGYVPTDYAPTRGRAGAIAKGFVVERNDVLHITDAGREAVGEPLRIGDPIIKPGLPPDPNA